MSVKIGSGSYATPRADLGAALMEHRHDPAQGPEFIGLEVLGVRPVRRKSANFSKARRESLLQNPDTKRQTGGTYNRGHIEYEDDSYACENYGWEQPLDDGDRLNYADDFEAEVDSVFEAEQIVRRAQEIRIAAAVFNTTTWDSTDATLYTDNSSSPWTTLTTDIIGQILDAMEVSRQNSGMTPDTLILGKTRFTDMLKNTGVRNQFPGAPEITIQMITDALARICGLRRVLVGQAVYNSAKEGQDATVTDVWSATYAMVAKLAPANAPITVPCIGRSFRWEPYAAEDYVVEQYREEQTESDIFRVKNHVDEKILIPHCGHLIQCVA